MTKAKLKDILARASKTFVQAFLSSFTIDSVFGVTDVETLKRIGLSILVGAVAAGISAVWNSLMEYIYNWIDKKFPVFVPEEDAPIEFETPMVSDLTVNIETEEEENVESI